MRPAVADEPTIEHTCDELAKKLCVPKRTIQRHVAVLAKLGAPGVRRGRRGDRRRWTWLVSDELLAQWKRGELPTPWASTIKGVKSMIAGRE